MLETPFVVHSFPIVPSDSVSSIIRNASRRALIEHMVKNAVPSLIFVTVDPPAPHRSGPA